MGSKLGRGAAEPPGLGQLNDLPSPLPPGDQHGTGQGLASPGGQRPHVGPAAPVPVEQLALQQPAAHGPARPLEVLTHRGLVGLRLHLCSADPSGATRLAATLPSCLAPRPGPRVSVATVPRLGTWVGQVHSRLGGLLGGERNPMGPRTDSVPLSG